MNHSEKGLETLTAMGTKSEDWGLAEIEWEKRVLPTEVWTGCPVCEGDGRVGILNGKTVPRWEAWNNGASKTIKTCTNCPRVSWTHKGRSWRTKDMDPSRRSMDNHHGDATNLSREMNGLVLAILPVERQVGIVQWAKGTKFDSRFARRYGATTGHRECELCAKAVPSGRFVPVTGKGADGVIHGAWVGEDCARKFFGVKSFKKEQMVLREGS